MYSYKMEREMEMENMKFKFVNAALAAIIFSVSCFVNMANAELLLVEQYDDFWSTDVNQLINYANNNVASSSTSWGIIDFTDDPSGFAGEIPGSNFWPSANGVNLGISHPINQTFFARITGDFSTSVADTYFFQTYNDDGVFLYIDGELIISDSGIHPEQKFEGSKLLGIGNHTIDLYFYENGGEASLEFTVADSSKNFMHFNDSQGAVTLVSVPEPSTLAIFSLCLIGLVSRRFNKKV